LFRIAVLVSGSGSNLEAIIEGVEKEKLKCSIEIVISDREGTFAIERARKRGIKTYVLDRKVYGEELSNEVLRILSGKVDFIVLAGFLSILRGRIVEDFKNKIINIHPSLIPAFCGSGMYGIRVHERAIEYGVKFSGCSVHFVDEKTDAGPIIIQKIVAVYDYDTPKSLQERILKEEHKAICEAIEFILEGRIIIKGRRVML
jgi:phosphoribosylglycinamide formyltransferase 1